MSPPYVELYCLSNFSFQRGASHPEELVVQAATFGYRALAITDECSLAGVVRAHREIRDRALPLKLILGSEIQLEEGPTLVVLATSRAGYGQLSRLITLGRRAADKGSYRLMRQDIEQGLSDCLALLLPPPGAIDAGVVSDACWLAQCFPRSAWIAVLLTLNGRDTARLAQLRALSARSGLPLVASSGALMHDAARRPLADVLTATRLLLPVADVGLALATNAERRLHTREVLRKRYPADLLA
ncbi:MAG: PHP domain-containing protein, partial [Azoarcus sp.]|nr:PHP domain-containing protein [Azoarcus sp.]